MGVKIRKSCAQPRKFVLYHRVPTSKLFGKSLPDQNNWRKMRGMKFARSMVLFGLLVCTAAAQQPTVNQNGVVNAASYATANPPGSLVTIFGTNLGTTALLIASSVPLSTHLKGPSEDVSATVNGTPAPMYYATATQSSVQLPWSVQPGTASIV